MTGKRIRNMYKSRQCTYISEAHVFLIFILPCAVPAIWQVLIKYILINCLINCKCYGRPCVVGN